MKFNFIFKISSTHGIDIPAGKLVRQLAVRLASLCCWRTPKIADALTKPFFMIPSRSDEYWAKWLARFPKASIILMAVQGGTLKSIRAGADAERFLPLPLETGRTHVAKTN